MATLINNSTFLLAKIESSPDGFIGFICVILGEILNFFFNIAYALTAPGSLAIAIIFLTIIVRIILFPTGIKTQQSAAVTSRLTPEVNKIKKKYGDTKDPELQRKMNMEIQNLYSKSGANPIMGCLPLLLTMPVFFALFALLKHSYLYVDQINLLYNEISEAIMAAPDYVSDIMNKGPVYEMIFSRIPDKMEFAFGSASDTMRIVNRFSTADWAQFKEHLPGLGASLQPLLEKKVAIESLFTINLIDNSGWGLPGIIIPILASVSQFFTSFISLRQTRATADPAAMQTQKIMMYGMPVMFFFITTGAAAGVGLYWTVSALFQALQQYILHKYYTSERIDSVLEKRAEKAQLKAERKALQLKR